MSDRTPREELFEAYTQVMAWLFDRTWVRVILCILAAIGMVYMVYDTIALLR